jgi:hypothetical protein
MPSRRFAERARDSKAAASSTSNWDGELCRRDQTRSRRLSDLGWDIERFWVYEIRDNPEGAVGRVKAWRSR